ncbi:MAG: Calx-beta domain-containing protein [Hyphomicrobium aestuarii]|nr:Calx-beta domain-containing protein [Hyphomicrobium aestuarii]
MLRTISNPTPAANDYFGQSVSLSGDVVVVGAREDNTGASDTGSAYVFSASTGALLQTLNNPAPQATDWFGDSVSVSADYVVVGAVFDRPFGTAYAGSAYLYSTSTGAPLRTFTNPTPQAGALQGQSVAVSASYVVVGAGYDDTGATDAGSVYVYSASTGSLLHTIHNLSPESGDQFGNAVAISGDYIVIGAVADNNGGDNAGSAYIYSASTGNFLQTIANPVPAAQDLFGFSVAAFGNYVVVGAVSDDLGGFTDVGAAYLFDTSGNPVRTLSNPDPAHFDGFGNSVAISGDTIVVGAYHDNAGGIGDTGTAYVFSASTAAPARTINNPTAAASDFFGGSVAVDGDTIVIGAVGDEDNVLGVTDAGVGYIFSASNLGLLQTIRKPASGIGEQFGKAVGISGNTVIITSSFANTGATHAGSAHLYNATTGALLGTLNDPTPASEDQFGYSAAINGDYVVVSAPFDDINGATDAGAAYLYEARTFGITRASPVAQDTISNPLPAIDDRFGKEAVAVTQNYTVVGADLDDVSGLTDAGSVSIYSTASGAFLRTLSSPTPNAGDNFGFAVAVSGDFVVVGAKNVDSGATDTGRAFIFSASTGTLLRAINNPTPDIGDNFGISVAISGDFLVIGAQLNDAGALDAGSAYIFSISTGALLRTMNNPSPGINDYFGRTLSISGDNVVIGAYQDDVGGVTNAGKAYLYSAASGGLIRTINNPAPATNDFFAASVAVDGDTVVLSATGADFSGASEAGTVYLFSATTGSLLRTINNPTPNLGDGFGEGLGFSNNTVVITSRFDDTAANDAGSAYVYDATTGSLLATLNSPSPLTGDQFGYTAAINGDYIVVAAPFVDVGAATDAGEAYLYSVSAATGNLAEGATATIQVSRTGAINLPVRVNLAIAGSALGGLDYGAVGPLVDTYVDIPAGQRSFSFNVPILTDAESEYDETLVVSVTGVLGATDFTVDPNNTAASFTILDTNTPIVEVENESYPGQDFTGTEGSGDTARFRLHRYGVRTNPLTVNVDFSGTATLGSDYSVTGGSTALSQQFTFPANTSTIDVILTPINDADQEGIEWSVIYLADGAPGVYTSLQTSPRAARATILDDEIPTVQLTSTDLTLTEAGQTTATIPIARLGGFVNGVLNVNFALSGTGSPGDYTVQGATFNSGTGLWTAQMAAGQSSVNVLVRAVDDTAPEADETINVVLADGSGYRRHPTLQQLQLINIDNDRPTVTIASSDGTAAEPGSNKGVFTLTRTGILTSPLTVSATFAGTATFGLDYEALPFTYAFLANQPSINVDLVPRRDTLSEPAEQVQMILQTGGGYTVGGSGAANINILDLAAGATLASFDWAMPERYGRDDNGNGLIDLPNSFAYANPTGGFDVNFDASSSAASLGIASFAWSIWDRTGTLLRMQTSAAPTYSTKLPEDQYQVELTITDSAGFTNRETQLVNVNDIMIVALGDSFMAGEGNPEISANNVLPPLIPPGASGLLPEGTWGDGPGHSSARRSSKAAASLAALNLENADAKSSVTFVFLAETGATVDGSRPGRGSAPSVLSQVAQAKSFIGSRDIDALLLQVGGNDIGFSTLIEDYIARVKVNIDTGWFSDDIVFFTKKLSDIASTARSGLRSLPAHYAQLESALRNQFGAQYKKDQTYLVQYPDMTRNELGQFSDIIFADYGDNIDEFYDKGDQLNALGWLDLGLTIASVLTFGLFGGGDTGISNLPVRIDAEEAAHASANVFVPLNRAVAKAGNRYGWNVVAAPSTFTTHGYGAAQPWFITATQSRVMQGGDAYQPQGAAHPNARGHQEIASALMQALSFPSSASLPTVDLPTSVQVGEGTALNVTAVANGTGLTFDWDLDFDGRSFSTDFSANSPSISVPLNVSAPGFRQVAVRVRDRNGFWAYDVMDVVVVPSAIVRVRDEVGSINLGEPFRFNLRSLNAPNDPIANWRIHWGDGTPDETLPGDWTSRTKVYANAATYNVRCWASDAGGEFEVVGATINVLNTSPMPVVSIAPTIPNTSEQTPGSPGRFTVSRTGATNIPLGVFLALSTGANKATNGVDYQLIPLSVFIPAGQSSVSFDIVPIADNLAEGVELVDVTVLPSSLYSQNVAVATVQIADGPNIDLNLVSGRVFNDLNGNGAINAGELGLVGRRIFDDLNHNSTYQLGEPFVLSDSSGNYTLGSLLSGSHDIVLEGTSGFVFTTPPTRTITVGIGETISGGDYGSAQPATLQGFVFADADLDGIFDGGEQSLGGWTVFTDTDFDGALDVGEANAITDGLGAYTLTGAIPGTLALRAVGPAGWVPTNGDTGGALSITATAGASLNDINLGQRREGPLTGPLVPSAAIIASGLILTLEATNPEAATSVVRFYRESNNIAGLQTGVGGDIVAGIDYTAVDDWGIVFRVGLNAGTYVFYSQAEDGYGFIGTPQSATITVTGNPGPNVASVVRVNDAVREDGSSPGIFEVRRTGSNALDLVVNITGVAGAGLAAPGTDYANLPTSVTIPAGDDAVRLQVYPVADAIAEGTELARVAVQSGAGYSVSASAGTADLALRDASSPNVVAVTSAAYEYDRFPPAPRVAFTANVVASLAPADASLFNLSTGQPVPPAQVGFAYDPTAGVARFHVSGTPTRVLPDGNYRLTLAASGITGPNGQPLDGNNDGIGGDDLVTDFFVLAGDANRDRAVNLDDFTSLAASFGQPSRVFSQGDFNYDQSVNLDDFTILASRFGTSLSAASIPDGTTTGAAETRVVRLGTARPATTASPFSARPILLEVLDDQAALV